ncbi:MAG: hypothetical protein ACE5E7_16010 [Anaerolineae bacterium]
MIDRNCLSVKRSLLLKCMRICWLILGYIWLVSCQQQPIDKSFLEGIPCASPCWQGITPGVTDEATAMTTLSNLDLVKPDSFDCGVHANDPSRHGCTFKRTSDEGGGISFKNGIVYAINIRSHIPLIDVIDAMGEPDFVRVVNNSLGGDDCYYVFSYYVRGIELFANGCVGQNPGFEFSPERRAVQVSADIPVLRLDFFMPGDDFESSLHNSHSDVDFVQRIMASAAPWTGYGFYELESLE